MHINPFLVIAGSTRPMRRSPVIADWVASLGAEAGDESFQVVDLRDLGLALDDEPAIPASGVYTRDTTRRWSALVAAAPGVVIVTPQYNWGYPAALKNALDHLYAEWRGKPVLVISYGGHGGDKCALQLRVVLTGLHARLIEAAPGLRLSRTRIEADDGEIDPSAEFAADHEEVRAALRALLALAAQPSDQVRK